MANLAQIQSIAQGQFFVKDSLGNLTELKVGDTVSLNDTIVAASSNTDLSKIEILFDTNELITLSQGEQLLDATLLASTFGNEELAFDKQEVDETLNAWNNAQDGDATDMETAAGDVTEQATNAGDERAADGGALRSKFNSRDGDATDIVSDLREASWTGGIERTIEDSENMLLEDPLPVVYTIEDSENMLLEDPLPVVYTIIEGIDVVNEGDSANYVVKLQDAAGNPVIATQDTIIYVRYTNKTTQDGDTQYNNENIIEVVIKAGTSQTEFTIKTNDDYLADNGEIYNVAITGNNSTEFDMRTGDVAGNKTNVDTTILDNSNPLNPGGEDGGYGSEDTVYVKISQPSETLEGGKLSHTVTLVDKDGNPVTIPAGEKIIVTLTYTSTDGVTDGDFSTIVKEVELVSNGTTFENTTIVDNTYEGSENYKVTITDVKQTNGTYENVAIHQTENSTTGKITDNPVEIVLVATDFTGTIPLKADGTVDLEANKNSTPEGGKLYYVAVAIDSNGKLLDKQTGTVDVSYNETADTTDKDATLSGTGKDIKNNPTVVEIGKTFTVDAEDDYYAEGDEKFNVTISNPKDTGYDTGVSVKSGADTVTSTIKDNPADSMKPDTGTGNDDPANGSYGKEDTVYVKISQPSETLEGGKLSHTVTLVDKDGNPVTIPAGEKIIVTLTYTSTDGVTDGDFSTIVKEVELVSNGTTFENTTIVDNTYEGSENYKVTITDVKQTNGTYENVAIHQTENSTTGKITDNPVEIVLVATDFTGTIPLKADGTVDLEANKNSTPEGGKLYYVAVAIDSNGKLLDKQTGTVDVSYNETADTTDKDATLSGTGKDIKNNPTVVEIGKTFTVDAEDDYYAEGNEKFEVTISTPDSTAKSTYGDTVSVSTQKTVTSTITDNPANSMKPDGATGDDDPVNGSYGKEDTVYVKINNNAETLEGGKLSHTVTLVDKDGNVVTIPAGEKIIVTLTYTSTDGVTDGDFSTIVKEVELVSNGTTFENTTIVDNTYEGSENYTVTITDVKQTNGTYENVAIHQTENSTTGKITDNPVEIVLVATDFTGTIPLKADGTVDLEANKNSTPEGGKLYYVAVAVDTNGKPLDVQAGTVTVSYGTTIDTTDKDATAGTDYDSTKTTATIGAVFSVDAKDDYYAEGNEKFEVTISTPDSTAKSTYGDTVSVSTQKTVTSTITDNPANSMKPDGATGDDDPVNGSYGKEDTVYVKINNNAETLEGGKLSHTVTLVDKGGNVVTIPAGEKIIVTLTYTSTDGVTDGDFSTIVKEVELVSNGTTFENITIVDNVYEGTENYTVTITGVKQEKGTYENVAIHQTENSTTGKITDNPVQIVLVATDSTGTIPLKVDGTVDLEANKNSTPEGGKLYYVAVAVDTNGKPLDKQTGKVDVSYNNTSDTTDKDAILSGTGKDIKNNPTVVEIGKTFTVDAEDDYYAEGDEKFNVTISNPKDTGYDTGVSVKSGADTVTSTIKDNPASDTENPKTPIEDGGYGSEDTVYAIITGETTVNEGGVVTYTVKLVDKDGNTVIPTKETTVTVTYTNIGTTSIDDTNKTNNQEIAVKINASGKGTFTVETKDDYWAEADENYNVKITNVQNTGEFENVKFDSYPNTIPNSPSNNVTTTIKDNPADSMKPDTNTGTDNPDGGNYGKEDTVYVRIVQDSQTIEGGNLNHKIQLVDKDGKPVEIPAGEKITVKLQYMDGTNVNDSDFVNSRQIEVTLDNSVKEDGYYKVQITNKTQVDFYTEGTEKYKLEITGVSQEKNTYENITIDSKNSSVTGTILDGITLTNPQNAYVDEDNFYTNKNDGTNSTTKNNNIYDKKNLGFTIPTNYETEVGTFSVNFVNAPTVTVDGNNYALTSNGAAVTYTVNGNRIKANAGSTKVFEIVLSKDGTYTYKQYANIDHPNSGDANTDYVNVNTNDNIDLNFKFNITTKPKNGEPSKTSDTQGFTVTVNDSTPDAGTRTETVNEDGTLTIVLSDEGFQKDPTDQSTKGQIEIDNGNGVYKTIAIDGTVDIYDKNEIVGTLKNNGNGTLTFTPNKDYSKYEADNGYLPNFKYKVSDTDGDYAQGQINIHVKPVADGTNIEVKNVETYEDNKNAQEGQNSVSLGLVQPTIKDNTDKNDTAKGDHGERVDYITLKFTNGASLKGAVLEKADGTYIAKISNNNQTFKIVIVKDDGSVDTDFHHSDITLGKSGVVYLTKEGYEGLKIQHAEDNDTDIVIKILTKTYEVDDSGKPLNAIDSTYLDKTNSNLSKVTTASMTVVIKPVTDDISLKWNDESAGTISDAGKTYTFNDIDEGNPTIDLKALLTKTSGTELNDGTAGNKADLDGSEIRTYKISDIPEGTVVTLGGQTAVANDGGIATIVFNDTNNKNADPDFSMKFPENYSGTVEGKITLSVYDNGVESGQRDTTDYGNGENGIKTAEVDFKVNVYPVANEATLKVSQAVGYEDAGRSQGNISNESDASKVDQPEKGISLDIKVSSTDTDGSETITININKIPSGGYIYYKGGLYDENGFVSGTKTDGVISTKSGDTWTITVPEYNNESPKFIPPHNSDKEYQLEVTAQTVDTAMIEGTEVIKKSDVSTPKVIDVIVKGVADVPVGTELNNDGNKNAYTVGENDLDSSGNKFDLKVIYEDASTLDSYDNDGSEELSIVIKGLPDGFSVEGALPTGDGEWAFNAKDLDKIKITTPSNFSGKASFTLTYVTTEREGNSEVHYTQDVNIYVNPEIDSTLNGQSVGNEDEVVTINLNLIHNNGDADETLEEVKISVDDVTGKDFTLFIGGVDIKDAGLTIKDGYYVLTPDQAKTITAQGKENISGEYKFDVKYTVKDVANDGKAEIKEFDATHNLVINPVTDKPTIDFGTIEVTGSNITVNGTDIKIVGDKNSTIKIPVETKSPDTDGSEKVVEIRIEGVPSGVKVVGGESSTEAFKISQNNGVWTIKVDETITDINKIIKNIKFEIDSDAKFSHREITITTVTQDKDAQTKEASKTITIDYDKAPGTGGGTGEAANFSLVAKDFIVTEDKEFRLTNLFDIKTNGGEVEGTSWTITLNNLPEGTIINGTVIGTDGKYVIESKLDGQDIYDIESIISSIKITPPANLNDDDNSTKSMTITATIETKVGQTVISTSEEENNSTILPVTDKMTVTVDAVNEIDESGSFEFGITLSSGGDKEIRTDIVGKTIVITVSENFESGETATGELFYNGQVLTPNANGQYEIKVPTGYKFGDKIEGLEYKSGEQRHGNVTITASIKHQETEGHDNYETNVENASGSATVNVKPVLDADTKNITIEANSVEDTIIDIKIDDTKFITDNSENLINVIFNDIPKDFIVYYKDANGNPKMAVNTGNGINTGNCKWLVPVVNGNLPDRIQIKAPENYSGEFKFNMDFYIKEEGLDLQKITKEATVNVTPIADGVTIDPTLSGIQDDGSYAKAFEWTDLNLNANMKDVDRSETLTLKFDGLSQNAQFRVLNEDGTSKSLEDALYENGEWTINGINVDDINNIQLLHDKEATVKVTASTVDTATDENGNPVGSSSTSTEVESTFGLRIDSSDIDNGKFTLGKEVNIDFSKIANGDIQGVSKIDLGAGNGKNELLNLTLDDVLSIGKKDGSGNINLDILGGTDDKVSFAKDNGWKKSELLIQDQDSGKTFVEWTNTGDSTVSVKVEQPISDGITN